MIFDLHVVSDPDELAEVQKFWGVTYREEGFVGKEELTEDGRYADEHDRYSHVVAVTLPADGLVGTLRLIPERPGEPFGQLEPLCGFKPTHRPAVEASRFVVHSDYRGSVVSFALMRWAIAMMRDLDVKACYAMVEPGLYQFFRRMGLPFLQEGEKRRVYNTDNLPIGMMLESVMESVERTDEGRSFKFAQFLRRASTGIISDEELSTS